MASKNYKIIKRILDIIISLALLIVLFPLMFIIAFFVKLETGGSAIFSQKRFGKSPEGRYRYFDIYSFRILKVKPKLKSQIHMETHNLPNWEEYLTYTGRFLRFTGLISLPSLTNVLIGNMSIGGPKPAVWDEVALIELRRKNNVSTIAPGYLGLVQARRLKNLTPKETAKVDLEYYENMSFLLDVKCFFGGIWNRVCNLLGL